MTDQPKYILASEVASATRRIAKASFIAGWLSAQDIPSQDALRDATLMREVEELWALFETQLAKSFPT